VGGGGGGWGWGWGLGPTPTPNKKIVDFNDILYYIIFFKY